MPETRIFISDIQPTDLSCLAAIWAGDDEGTHHLVPIAGVMTCTYCKKPASQIRQEFLDGMV